MSLENPDQDHSECHIYSTCASAVLAAFTVLLHPRFYATCHRRRSINNQMIVEYRAHYGRSLAKVKLSKRGFKQKSVLTPLLDRRLNLPSQGRQYKSYILYKGSGMFYTVTLYRRYWNRMETKRNWRNASSRTRWKQMESDGTNWKLLYHTKPGLG